MATCLIHWSQTSEKIRFAAQIMNKSRSFKNVKNVRFSLTVKQRFANTTNSKQIMTEIYKKLNEVLAFQRGDVFVKETNIDEMNNFFMNNGGSKLASSWNLGEESQCDGRIETISWVTFDTLWDRNTVLELTSKIQELKNEVNCMNDSRDFQDTESARNGHSHVPSQPVFFPFHLDRGGMQSRSMGMPSRNNGPPSIWDTHGILWHVFAMLEKILGSQMCQNTHHHMNDSQTPTQHQRNKSKSSSRNLFVPVEKRHYQWLRSKPTSTTDFGSSFLTNSPRQQRLLVGR